MHGRGMAWQREDAVGRPSESRVVVLDITSRIRRSADAPPIRARRKPLFSTKALRELRRVFEARRQLRRGIALERVRFGARRAALRAARRRELMAWACCQVEEAEIRLEAGAGFGGSPAGSVAEAEVRPAALVKTFPIDRVVRSEPGDSHGASYSHDDWYPLDTCRGSPSRN